MSQVGDTAENFAEAPQFFASHLPDGPDFQALFQVIGQPLSHSRRLD
jgi:hypothetical protein